MAVARRSGLLKGFRNDSQLQQYYLDGVVPTGNTLGVGSYGSVVEVLYRQVSCAAKRMHELLFDPGNDGVQDAIQKYRRECQLMASLRHPNITQFLGLCFLDGSELPLLVMEKLEMSVDDLLECAPNIPLPVKISILTDTCSGLVYLHGMPSPIVHRDLTARNVLLTSSLSAKITDMGNSRMLSLKPAQLAQTMSKLPGTLVYMPPEALNDTHKYGPSLDVFSFGHLALYNLIQSFPGDLLSATHVDPHNPGRVIGRTEVERREVYMKKLENQFMESHPILVELVTNCLHNNPQTRPSSEQLVGRLLPLKKEMNLTHGGTLLNVTHVLHIKEIKEKYKRIKELEILETQNGELTETITRLENDKRRLITAKSRIEEEKNQLEVNINQLKDENKQLKTKTSQLNSSCHQQAAEKLQLESRHQQEESNLQLKIDRLSRELQGAKAMLGDKTSQTISPIFPLQLDWSISPDMPVAMDGYVQSVEINGTFYVGGGWTKREDEYVVMAYNTQSCQWHTLPPCSTRLFGMTTIYNKLVLVGGKVRDDTDSSELAEWQPDSKQWTHPFPPMPKPCCVASTTSYKHWLVVAGGYYGDRLRSVMLLDIQNMQWSTGPSMPISWDNMKSITIEDTWYFMGGDCSDVEYGPDVYGVSLEALVTQSVSQQSNVWIKLPSLSYARSCPIRIEGSLLAVGGRDMQNKKPVYTIQRYVPETNAWVHAGQLPHAVYDCTSITVASKIYVIGGYNGKKLRSLFTSDF